MNNSVIHVDGVRKQFRGNEVLKGVSFDVKPGQTFALLGRNGAGKTTLIRMLLGLLVPDAGSVGILGINPRTNPLAVRRRVGYLAEDQRMFGWMTVEQLVRFIAPFYDAWDDALAEQYLTQFELPRQTKIKNLSKGQNVRLGLILALAHPRGGDPRRPGAGARSDHAQGVQSRSDRAPSGRGAHRPLQLASAL